MNWTFEQSDRSWYDYATPYHVHFWPDAGHGGGWAAYRSGLPIGFSRDAEEMKTLCERDAISDQKLPALWTQS